MISRVDHMQISTIHACARDLIARLGSSFGCGIDVGITSGEFCRRRKIFDLLDDYIRQKTKEYGKDYSDRLSLPVYALRDSIYDLEMRAKNYLLHDIIGKSRGGAVRAYAGSHMAMRRLFGKAWFSAELSGAVPHRRRTVQAPACGPAGRTSEFDWRSCYGHQTDPAGPGRHPAHRG